jgi:hypothetical protein
MENRARNDLAIPISHQSPNDHDNIEFKIIDSLLLGSQKAKFHRLLGITNLAATVPLASCLSKQETCSIRSSDFCCPLA